MTVEVGFVLKGVVEATELKIRLGTRGNRAFDPALKEQTGATFFLKKGEDGIYRTAYPGSVAVFPMPFAVAKKRAGVANFQKISRGMSREEVVRDLYSCLDEGMYTTRYWANESLKKLTKQDFGFVWNAPESEREMTIMRWKQFAKTDKVGPSDLEPASNTNRRGEIKK